MKRLFAWLLLLAVMSHPALSRDLLPSEQDKLQTQIERFSAALNAQDFDFVGRTVPPKSLSSLQTTRVFPSGSCVAL